MERSGELGQRLSVAQLQHLQGISRADMQPLHTVERSKHHMSGGTRAVWSYLPQALLGSMVQQPEESKLPALLRGVEPYMI